MTKTPKEEGAKLAPIEMHAEAVAMRNNGFSWKAIAERFDCTHYQARALVFDRMLPRAGAPKRNYHSGRPSLIQAARDKKQAQRKTQLRRCVQCGFEVEYPWRLCNECGKAHRYKLAHPEEQS